MNNVFIVVISQSAAEFFVVHFGFVLSRAPSAGHLVGVGELELPAVARPADEVLAGFVGEKFQEELPQLDRSTPCKNDTATLL